MRAAHTFAAVVIYLNVGYLFIIIMLLFDSMTCTCGFFNTLHFCLHNHNTYHITYMYASVLNKNWVKHPRNCFFFNKTGLWLTKCYVRLMRHSSPQRLLPHNLMKHSPAEVKVTKAHVQYYQTIYITIIMQWHEAISKTG